MSYVATYLLAISLLALLFFWTGRLLAWPRRAERHEARSDWIESLALGAALWMALVFALAAVGLLRPLTLYTAILVVVGASLMRRRAGGLHLLPVFRRPEWLAAEATLAVALGALGVALFLQTLTPAVSWDANVYHLTVPQLWIEHGGFRAIPYNVYSNWPLNTELLYGLAMALQDHVLAKLVHFLFGVSLLVAVYGVTARVASRFAGLLAATLVLCNQVVLAEIRVAYVDLAFTLFFFLAFLRLHEALESRDWDRRDLLLAGVLAGVAGGIKPTGWVAPLCLGLVLFLGSLRRRSGLRQVSRSLLLFLAPAMLLLLPWLVKTWLTTGNPVYPFFYELFGGPEWSEELGRQFVEWQRGIGMGRGWRDYLLLPLRVILVGGPGYDRFDGQIHPLWLVWIPVAAWSARRSSLARRGLWVVVIYFVFWALTSQQMRFLIAALPLLSVAAALGIKELIQKAQPGRSRGWIKAAATLVFVLLIVQSGAAYAVGAWRMSAEYLRYGPTLHEDVVPPVYRFINDELPAKARVMMVNTNLGFFCHRDYIADSFFEASQMRHLLQPASSKEQAAAILAGQGITHLLVDGRDLGILFPHSFFELLKDTALAEVVYSSEDQRYAVLEMRQGK
jgi:hypothetical protein